jgi:hypothetical protein
MGERGEVMRVWARRVGAALMVTVCVLVLVAALVGGTWVAAHTLVHVLEGVKIPT